MMLYDLVRARVVIRTHSAIGGPWIPLTVVTEMEEWVKMGWLMKWSIPAERRWISVRLVSSAVRY